MSHALVSRPPTALSEGGDASALAIQAILTEVCQEFTSLVDQERLQGALLTTLPDSATSAQFWQALLLAARAQIEMEPAYTFVAARALLLALIREAVDLEIAYVQDCLPQAFWDFEPKRFATMSSISQIDAWSASAWQLFTTHRTLFPG